jgi:hypothetical protein
MASFDFGDYIPLYSEFLNELYEFSLHVFRLWLGFQLGYEFINFQSFIDWLWVIAGMNFVLIKINSEVLHQILPESMHGLLVKNIIAEMISLGIICFVLQQNLFFLAVSRVLYFAFCFFSYLFSRLLLESIGIAYYMKSAWYLLPVGINVLISMFYLFDRYFDMEIFNYFLELQIVQGIFAELGIQTDMFLNTKIDINPKDNQYYHLILKDHVLLNEFRKHFLSSISRVPLKNKINEFRKHLSDLYHLQKPIYRSKLQEEILLPLKWSDLKVILQKVPKLEHDNIFKIYYRNTYHTVWRLLDRENSWLSKDLDSIKHHENFQESHYQELLLYMWIRAQKNQTKTQFLLEIANIYRKRNFSHRGLRIFDEKIDNDKPDMPDSIEHFQIYVLNQLERCRHTELLTENKIRNHWNQAIANYWKNQLMKSSVHEFFEIRYLWKEALAGKKDIRETSFKEMDLNLEFKKEFIRHLKHQYGEKYQTHHTNFINQLFALNHGFHCHIEKFCLIFSKVMKTYFHQDLPAKLQQDFSSLGAP